MTVSLADVLAGGKAAVARALTAIEENGQAPATAALLDEAFAAPKAHVIGITGPPGAGKSTLIDACLKPWRDAGLKVAVLAVDPSSQTSRGSLLGDRIRMRTDPGDDGVFIRSLAARGRLGGLSDAAYPAAVLLRAIFDTVIVESVGVGQSETDIAAVADTVVLCIQPGSGDSLQFMKAGIVEVPDIAVVTKGDMGAVAGRALADLKGALQLSFRGGDAWQTRCQLVSAGNRAGLDAFLEVLNEHWVWLAAPGRLQRQRQAQAGTWLKSEIQAQFGQRGVMAAQRHLLNVNAQSPFQRAAAICASLRIVADVDQVN